MREDGREVGRVEERRKGKGDDLNNLPLEGSSRTQHTRLENNCEADVVIQFFLVSLGGMWRRAGHVVLGSWGHGPRGKENSEERETA